MRLQVIATVLLISVKSAWTADPDSDEGRPYEFGFTIDGQQHRHESKDINGIIMGEFGFITADGVYHVTVYATDENGSFKILSMRNIKVSDRLDLPGAKLPDKLPIGNLRPVKEVTTTTYRPVTTSATQTTPKSPYRFTTVPSLKKPSCSSCSLPSTTPRAPNSDGRLPFQTPQFQPGYKEPKKDLLPPKKELGETPDIRFGTPVNRPDPGQNPPGSIPQVPNRFGPGNPPSTTGIIPRPPGQTPNVPSHFVPSGNPQNPIETYPRPPVQNQNIPNNFGTPGNAPGRPNRFGDPQNALVPFSEPKKPVREIPPKVTVDKGVISVPGKDPIPIKDKYPNMQDGLPLGITEHDMLNLLYKFNYTVGFHGHYEKGLKNGAKIGGYFVNGRDGISRVVEYIADENGYRPKVKFINFGLDSPYTPKEGTEKSFGLQGFEFTWYPV